MNQSCDVLICGGGMAGLTLALQLSKTCPELSVQVLEKRSDWPKNAAFKVGESTVELAAHYLAHTLDLDAYLRKKHLIKYGFRLFFGQGNNEDITKRTELGVGVPFPTEAFQIDRAKFERDLANTLSDKVIMGCQVTNLSKDGERHIVEAKHAGKVVKFEAKYLVDATGRARKKVRLEDSHQDTDHPNFAVWFRTSKRIKIDDWGNQKWRERIPKEQNRYLSTNHLVGDGYWIWIIPLPDGETSIGLVTHPDCVAINKVNRPAKLVQWLEKHEPQLAKALPSSEVWLDFHTLNHYAHQTKQVFFSDKSYISGEAGLFLDPFYSPGADFIAISNSFITDIIQRSEKGEPTETRISFYNQFILSYFENSLLIYQNQYHLFGDPYIMTLKIIWDYALYWGVFCYTYCQNCLTDVRFLARIQDDLKLMGDLHKELQAHFRESEKGPSIEGQFINKAYCDWLANLNAVIDQPVPYKVALTQFKDNIEILKELHLEISQVLDGKPFGKLLAPLENLLQPHLV